MPLFAFLAPKMMEGEGGNSLLAKTALLVFAAVGSLGVAAFAVGFVGLAFFAIKAAVAWLCRAPLRHALYIIIGCALLVAFGWLGSLLGMGQGTYCEPDARGGVNCYEE